MKAFTNMIGNVSERLIEEIPRCLCLKEIKKWSYSLVQVAYYESFYLRKMCMAFFFFKKMISKNVMKTILSLGGCDTVRNGYTRETR